MKKFISFNIGVIFVFFLFGFFTEQALAGCEYTTTSCNANGGWTYGSCPPGYSCGSYCTCSGGSFSVRSSDCTVEAGTCIGDSGLSANQVCQRDICGGGGCPNTTCGPNYSCGGGGPAGYGCQAQSDVWCDQRNTLGQYGGTSTYDMCKGNGGGNCNWDQIPNENVGKCSGHSCTAYCTQKQYDGGTLCGECDVIATNYCCNYSDPTSPNYVQGNGYCSGAPTGTCQYNSCGAQTTTCSVCSASSPQSITSPSPANGATSQLISVSLTFPYNSSTFNWGIKCPSPNSDSFTFYLDTNTNPTTLKCTNGPSTNPASVSNSCAVSGLSYSTTYYWKVVASNGGTSTTSGPWSFTTQNAQAWWQVKDADVITNGTLQSIMPSSGLYFGLNGTGGYHGIPTYGPPPNSATFGSGIISQPPAWLVQTTTSYRKTYNYAFFKSQIPSDVQANIIEINSTSVAGSTFTSGGTATRGYVWYHFNGALGDLTITSDVSLGSRKVILLVDGVDLNINGKINLTKGAGFFMAVIGKNSLGAKGNIIVGPSVSGSTSLEGIYLSENQFKTGAGTVPLNVRGAVAAYGGIVLERNLGSGNSTTPAEVFEYAPDLMVLYPNVFTDRKIRWKEVAP